jgi:hypothetical protein
VVAGTTNASSTRIAKLEEALKKAKETLRERIKNEKYQHAQTRKAAKKAEPKAPKVKTARVKMTEEEKGQRKREKAVVKELAKVKQQVVMKPLPAQAEPMMPAPVAAPSLAPAAAPVQPKGGRTRRRLRR